MEDAFKTHDLFFQVITRKKLNELLNRATGDKNMIENHINQRLKNKRCEVKLSNKNTYCDIFIGFFNIDNKNQLGHISFHIASENKLLSKNSRKNGRFHAKNNINKNLKYTLRFNKVNDTLKISLDKVVKIRKEFEECLIVALAILNEYFNHNSELYLGNRLTRFKDEETTCFKLIENSVRHNPKTQLKNTRKQPRTITQRIIQPTQLTQSVWKKSWTSN
jgi:hypothetical protein